MKSITVALFSLLLLTSACGIKPADVDPPQGEEKDYFPRTYPTQPSDPNPQRYLPPR